VEERVLKAFKIFPSPLISYNLKIVSLDVRFLIFKAFILFVPCVSFSSFCGTGI
jgi:hypothetical protein